MALNAGTYKALQRCPGKHSKYIFTYKGNPIKGIDNNTWKRACKKAGFEDFHWHDLRHTCASWHIQAGSSLNTLMELGGWASYEMVLRYADLSSGQLHDAAAVIDQAPGESDSENSA